MSNSNDTYKIMRFFQRPGVPSLEVASGLTLEQAQAHCQDPETSSRTCELPERRAITEEHGEWFDGFTRE
jgi:hypothetical protein